MPPPPLGTKIILGRLKIGRIPNGTGSWPRLWQGMKGTHGPTSSGLVSTKALLRVDHGTNSLVTHGTVLHAIGSQVALLTQSRSQRPSLVGSPPIMTAVRRWKSKKSLLIHLLVSLLLHTEQFQPFSKGPLLPFELLLLLRRRLLLLQTRSAAYQCLGRCQGKLLYLQALWLGP